MRMKIWFATALLVLGTLTAALAQEHKMDSMSPEQKAAMDAMMKAMTPGDAHKQLQPFVGDFDAKITMWSNPAAPPTVTTGTSQNKWVLGDRYIEQHFTSSMMGMPFYGIGYMGYDNVKKSYWGSWIDNFSTGLMTSTGAMTDSKSWKFAESMSDPVSGKSVTGESRFTVVDADHHAMEMWGPGPDGKMFKMMEIAYTRKK
jgi:hypothetical protein